ncbi:MAG: hypothetical protein E7256_02920 [Lachnospiraceae bacterium]|nr:hypothetical protein [Lachnospiraceae bacterium]
MAFDIQNTATLLSYTYFSGDREKTGGPKYDTVVNSYVAPTITLDKVCSVVDAPGTTGVDLDEIVTLTYTVTNKSAAPITYTTATIQDPVLIAPQIDVLAGTETGGTHDKDIITVDLLGGLAQGQSKTYTIQIKVTGPSTPVDILHTKATATLGTAAGNTNKAFNTCNLNYNHAELTIDKQNSPMTPVTYGQEITYTIVLGNVGMIPGRVGVGQFVDLIPDYTVFRRIDNNGGGVFAYEASPVPRIYNSSAFTLAHDETRTLVFTVVTVEQ